MFNLLTLGSDVVICKHPGLKCAWAGGKLLLCLQYFLEVLLAAFFMSNQIQKLQVGDLLSLPKKEQNAQCGWGRVGSRETRKMGSWKPLKQDQAGLFSNGKISAWVWMRREAVAGIGTKA